MGDPGERAELQAFRDFYGLLEQEGAGTRLEIAGAVGEPWTGSRTC